MRRGPDAATGGGYWKPGVPRPDFEPWDAYTVPVLARAVRRVDASIPTPHNQAVVTPVVRPGQVVREPAPIAQSSQLLIYVGGVISTVQFAGLVAPGQYQLNVVVPNLRDGDQMIVAEINGFRSPSGISIPVKN